MQQHDPSRDERELESPGATASVGLWFFLAALAMLFASSLVGYFIIRTRAGSRFSIHIPNLFWLSTALMLTASFALQHALTSVRRGRRSPYLLSLWIASAFAIGFVIVQSFAMPRLLAMHAAMRSQGSGLYGLVFFLILLHALHVVGGLIALARIVNQAHRGPYGEPHQERLRHAVLYWHFLDGVWLIMFAVLWGLG